MSGKNPFTDIWGFERSGGGADGSSGISCNPVIVYVITREPSIAVWSLRTIPSIGKFSSDIVMPDNDSGIRNVMVALFIGYSSSGISLYQINGTFSIASSVIITL